MMLTICACGVYEVEQKTAHYFKGEKPMCHEETCAKARYHNRMGYRRITDNGQSDETEN